jgi:dTDP-4-dehydrorhamnose 3,5-epimerase
MHFQLKHPQSQLLTVMRGTIFDVVVDLRHNSPTFRQWYGTELGESGQARQIYMSPGFAHGFCVLSDCADLHYKVSRKYTPSDEGGLLWNDADVGIQWPLRNPLVCERDARYPHLSELAISQLPHTPYEIELKNG